MILSVAPGPRLAILRFKAVGTPILAFGPMSDSLPPKPDFDKFQRHQADLPGGHAVKVLYGFLKTVGRFSVPCEGSWVVH